MAESSWMALEPGHGVGQLDGDAHVHVVDAVPRDPVRVVSANADRHRCDQGLGDRLAVGEEVAPQRSGTDREVRVVEAPAERMSHGEQLGERERRHREGPLAWQRDVERGAGAIERLRGADRCPRAAPGRRGRVASRLRHELRKGSELAAALASRDASKLTAGRELRGRRRHCGLRRARRRPDVEHSAEHLDGRGTVGHGVVDLRDRRHSSIRQAGDERDRPERPVAGQRGGGKLSPSLPGKIPCSQENQSRS